MRNVSVAASEWEGEVVFLRKLVPGGASRSYGIEVARLAGLPAEVVARARRDPGVARGGAAEPGGAAASGAGAGAVAAARAVRGGAPDAPGSAAALGAPEEALLERLRRVDLDDLSPRAAWELLSELQKKLTALDYEAHDWRWCSASPRGLSS